MQKIVVAKLIRLGKDGDSFSKSLVAQTMRTNAKVTEQYIEEFNASWKTRGQLYVIDQAATEIRDEQVQKPETKVKTDNGELSIREALKKEADELGIEYAKNISNEKLADKISNAK